MKYKPVEHLKAYPEFVCGDKLKFLNDELAAIYRVNPALSREDKVERIRLLANEFRVPNHARPNYAGLLWFIQGLGEALKNMLALRAAGDPKPGDLIVVNGATRRVKSIGENSKIYFEGGQGGYSPLLLLPRKS